MNTSRLVFMSAIWCCMALLPAFPASAEIQNICAGSVPPGWVVINDSWSPTTCGNPVSMVYNVATIERYDNKTKGSVMQACLGPVPAGWAMVGSRWNPSVCGHPASMIDNVMTIRKLN